MFICDNLVHPFQNEPGTSQRQRIMDDLLSGSAKIDGRSMADLLDYFVQLSRHINYYHTDLSISDWQPFFQKSIPFSLAAIIKYNRNTVSTKIDAYTRLFEKHPSKAGLQLLFHYFFYQIINQVNTWHLQLKGSGLPAELIIEKLVKDKLQEPLKQFICHNNAAVKWYCVKPINFLRIAENTVWNLDLIKLNNETDKCKPTGKSKRKRLIKFYNQVKELLPAFLDAIRIISDTSVQSMEQSLFPLKEELQKQHSPHLALLFAFLKLFQHLQGDLNKFTKKHLDFFYKQVLKLTARDAIADKAHIVFEIQKQLDTYLLKKGLQVKDGKDNNKAEILFALEDELVVNKAQVADKRTLFLNNQDAFENTYVEGVYMAPNADKADGLTKDFKDANSKSFATLGAKLSKYTDPEKTLVQPYPNARLGFILASPVLLMKEGKRTIDITLACQLKNNCDEMQLAATPTSSNCCEETTPGQTVPLSPANKKYPNFFDSPDFYSDIADALNETYYYISEDLIVEATKKGISKELEKKLRNLLVEIQTKINSDTVCYCPTEIKKYDKVLRKAEWDPFYFLAGEAEKKILDQLIKARKALKVYFSGEKEWIEPKIDPAKPSAISISPDPLVGDKFILKINVSLEADQPAVTFYNKDTLKEDFNTTQPLVKIELDDKIKLVFSNNQLKEKIKKIGEDDICCLLKEISGINHDVSLYHFFRNVIVIDELSNEKTRIDVSVCGLKNFVVQNEESVQDVNGPVYPFGTRPEIVDFDIVNPANPPLINPNLIGPNFYIGSKEVFCKKWNSVRINLNWKDKPSNFREYYKAYVVEDVALQIFGLDQDRFKVRFSSLQNSKWAEEASDRKLFDVSLPSPIPPLTPDVPSPCLPDGTVSQGILLNATNFPGQVNQPFSIENGINEPFKADSKSGFIKVNLRNQDFLHKDYSFVLARQMMALGKYPDAILEGAVYKKDGNTVIVFRSLGKTIVELKDEIFQSKDAAQNAKDKVDSLTTTFDTAIDFPPPLSPISNAERNTLIPLVHDSKSLSDASLLQAIETKDKLTVLQSILDIFDIFTGEIVKPLTVLIPNEPWTPIIKNISLDYTATATNTDIDLIHLYPYEGTYKKEEITLQPALFPTFCDEGTLFIGLKDLVPGSNVNMLFQLAEATADSESDREDVNWHYLDNNQWKSLRNGFEVLDEATDGLTTSGIVKFALPENMTKDNTILPKDLHWIKASIPKNSKTASETIGLFTQAIRAVFTNEVANDKLRLEKPLEAGAISKLNEADANIKKLSQPFDSFGGRQPEAEGHFYIRVSELLRHKGRAIQKFDYERLALEAFPQLFKVKCINHSFALNAYKYKNDFPIAPGYVLLAVIPDLNQLKAAQSFEPRVPVSLLDDIEEYIRKITSPFVRFRAMNPRYEKIHFCLKVKLLPGKDENYYNEKLKQDLREFMAPWAVGIYDKLTFGQCVSRSEIIRFLETRDYIDYIIELIMRHNDDPWPDNTNEAELILPVCPKTPRSILIAGNIDVCIPEKDCEEWQKCLNAQGLPVDCCENKKIPIADYCIKDVIG